MNKLSKREKVLLYFLCIIGLVAGGWFLIKPAIEESATLDQSIIDAETNKSLMDQTIATRSIYEESIANATASIAEIDKSFLAVMNNDDLDRYITGLLQKNGLIAESLLISASEDTVTSIAATRLFVKVSATGELDQFMTLVQQLSELSGIRISTFVVQQRNLVTKIVPLTEDEIAAQNAATEAAGKKVVETDEVPTKEITVYAYHIELGFEVVEYDEQIFQALIG